MRNPFRFIAATLTLFTAIASAQDLQTLEPSAQASEIQKQNSIDTEQTVSMSLGAVLRKTQDTIEVRSTLQHSVAQRSGLEIGDRIVSLNGKPVSQVSKLEDAITNGRISEHLILVVEREDELAMVDLNAPKQPASKLLSISNLTPAALAALEGTSTAPATRSTAPRPRVQSVVQRVSYQQPAPVTQTSLPASTVVSIPAAAPTPTAQRVTASYEGTAGYRPPPQAAPAQNLRPTSPVQRNYTSQPQSVSGTRSRQATRNRVFRRRPRRTAR